MNGHTSRLGASPAAIIITLVVIVVIGAFLGPLLLETQRVAKDAESQDHLRRIVQVLAGFDADPRTPGLPPGTFFDREKNPVHGWQSVVAPVFFPPAKRLDRGKTWDDPANEKIAKTRIRQLQIPENETLRGKTGYALMHYAGNAHVFNRGTSPSLSTIKSGPGLRFTFLIGEINNQFRPWGEPFNWRPLTLQLNTGAGGYGRPGAKGAYFAMADESVRFLSQKVDSLILEQMRDAWPTPKDDLLARPVWKDE